MTDKRWRVKLISRGMISSEPVDDRAHAYREVDYLREGYLTNHTRVYAASVQLSESRGPWQTLEHIDFRAAPDKPYIPVYLRIFELHEGQNIEVSSTTGECIRIERIENIPAGVRIYGRHIDNAHASVDLVDIEPGYRLIDSWAAALWSPDTAKETS